MEKEDDINLINYELYTIIQVQLNILFKMIKQDVILKMK